MRTADMKPSPPVSKLGIPLGQLVPKSCVPSCVSKVILVFFATSPQLSRWLLPSCALQEFKLLISKELKRLSTCGFSVKELLPGVNGFPLSHVAALKVGFSYA